VTDDDRPRCGDADLCVLPAGHGGSLHAGPVQANLLRVCWATEGNEALIVETLGENPVWVSAR